MTPTTSTTNPYDSPGPVVAMIFEFWLDSARPSVTEDYLRESERVRELLVDAEGFLGVERFRSTADPDKFVAIGFFADEDAVTRWRTTPGHRRVQALGRRCLFTRYRLRMARVVRDYDAVHRDQAPLDSRAAHDTSPTCGTTTDHALDREEDT